MMDIAMRRATATRILRRVMERYDQRVIENVWRSAYVEQMVEMALQEADPAWTATREWASWAIEHVERGYRIDVKQSVAFQTWFDKAPPSRQKPATFNIKPAKGCFDGFGWIDTPLRRHADIYVVAWHPETEEALVDHRDPLQWLFYVTPEHKFTPGQKTIDLNPMKKLARECVLEDLAEGVAGVAAQLPTLKAELNS